MAVTLTYEHLQERIASAGGIAGNAASLAGNLAPRGASASPAQAASGMDDFFGKFAGNLQRAEQVINSISNIANNPLVKPYAQKFLPNIAGISGTQPANGGTSRNLPMGTPLQSPGGSPVSPQMTSEQLYTTIKAALDSVMGRFGDKKLSETIDMMVTFKPQVIALIEQSMQAPAQPKKEPDGKPA